MENRTIRSLFLLMVITGSIFALTACGPEKGEVKTVENKAIPKVEKVENVEKKEVEKVEKVEKKEVKRDDFEENKSEKKGEDDKNVAPKVEVTPPPAPEPVVSTPVVKVTRYADGTYTKTGLYLSPAGTDSVTVTVTVKDDVVQDVNVVGGGTNNEASINFQKLFIGGVNSQVVGKKLADVKAGVVNGSSLTGDGFNEAIAAIQASAQK